MRHRTDLELVLRSQQGDRDALEQLVLRHRRNAESVARVFFVSGMTIEDLRQEALVALLQAIRDFRPDAGASFETFWRVCVWRELVTCLKASRRQRQRPLNEAVRIGRSEEGVEIAIGDLIPDPRADVVELAEVRAELGRLLEGMDSLSELERISLVGTAFGYSYAEIQERVGEVFEQSRRWRPPFKGADNAIQRARHKLRRAA